MSERPMYYRLDGHEAVPLPDDVPAPAADIWADRTVRSDLLFSDVRISTVFLAIDHGWEGPPLVFETMIFGGKHDEYQARYSTWDEAVAGHARAVAMVRRDDPSPIIKSVVKP